MKALILALSLVPFGAAAQTHDHSMTHGAAQPGEAGQGGFAVLAEITRTLRADTETDWSKVYLGRLRAHLQDMDQIVTLVDVVQDEVPDGLRIKIARGTPGADAALSMVPAHGPVLATETGWLSNVEVNGAGIIWTVTDTAAAAQIRGLGFFGLMTVGNHHPQHHLAMAKGDGHEAH